MNRERSHFGEYRRATEERPLGEKRRARWEREVAEIRARAYYGPAHDAALVTAQRLFLVRAGLMSAREAFAPQRYTPTR